MTKAWWKEILEGTDTRAARIFDLAIQLLIVFAVVTFTIETLPDLSPSTRRMLERCEIAIFALFTLRTRRRSTSC